MFQLFDRLIKKVRGRTYEERMHNYLSQATSMTHLERLEQEWFDKNPRY